MRRCVLLLLLSALALAALCACAQETTPPPETSPAQVETAPAEPVQNSDELLALLEERGIPRIVASSSPRAMIKSVIGFSFLVNRRRVMTLNPLASAANSVSAPVYMSCSFSRPSRNMRTACGAVKISRLPRSWRKNTAPLPAPR